MKASSGSQTWLWDLQPRAWWEKRKQDYAKRKHISGARYWQRQLHSFLILLPQEEFYKIHTDEHIVQGHLKYMASLQNP